MAGACTRRLGGATILVTEPDTLTYQKPADTADQNIQRRVSLPALVDARALNPAVAFVVTVRCVQVTNEVFPCVFALACIRFHLGAVYVFACFVCRAPIPA